MKQILPLILAALCGTASAQSCLPSDLGGPGTAASVTINARGQAVVWWCPDGSHWLAAMRWSQMTDAIGAGLEALRSAGDKRAAVDLLASFRDTPIDELRDVWAPLQGVLDNPPAVRRWRVKPNGVTTTRPAYLVTDGVRGTREAGRAPVGALCAGAVPPGAAGDLWAEFDAARPGLVALCSLQ